ncbi:hypothetical protein NPIL_501071 [Nephila pilipes]|uniref:Uncharacterized protein n=1 Tax=Nephila pilipes TaxID=299642 RepID=A0A8X6KLC9_NEPPI|nr:hypothetical protein NPIL_501071 [Nephila pilipes]
MQVLIRKNEHLSQGLRKLQPPYYQMKRIRILRAALMQFHKPPLKRMLPYRLCNLSECRVTHKEEPPTNYQARVISELKMEPMKTRQVYARAWTEDR